MSVLYNYQCYKCKVKFFSGVERKKVVCPVCGHKKRIQVLEEFDIK